MGNIYITGYFHGILDFDPSADTANLTSISWQDIFIAKYDAAGNYLYAKNMGGTNFNYNYGNSIAVDTSGNVYITGYFNGTVDFDLSANVVNLTSNGNSDIFIAKYDDLGNYVWANKIGGVTDDNGNSIAVDTVGNVYITGYFNGTVDFNPSAGVAYLTSSGNADIFIAKYDATGNYIYAKNMGGMSFESGYSIAVDASGNAYITGCFTGTADFDPSANVVNLTSVGTSDVFIAKYDGLGNYIYAKNMGGTSQNYAISIALDTLGNVYITGNFYGTTDFDPSANVVN